MMQERLHLLIEGIIPTHRPLWISFYTVLVGCTIFIAFSHWAYDDPYISYRYSHNLAHGLGFVYNPGERLLSTTSPFFVLLLAILSPIWSDLPHLANLIGAFSLALGGVFLWDLALSWKSPAVGWANLLLYPTFPLLISTLGSETPLYLAFCLASFAFYVRQNNSLTAVFAALAILTRPDGVILPVLLSFDFLLRLRRPFPLTEKNTQWKAALLFLALTLPWFIFAWLYYGSPLPLTLAAKQHQGSMAISQRFATGFFSTFGWYAGIWQYQIEATLALLGALSLCFRARHWTLFISWPILYFIGYSVLGVSGYFWYYAPLVPGFLVLVGLGLAVILDLGKLAVGQLLNLFRPETQPTWINPIPYMLTTVLIASLFLAQASNLQQLRKRPDTRYPLYRAAGDWLRMNTPENASVGTLEVGIIGYYSERLMVDFAGLLQPDIAAHLTPATTFADAAQWAAEHYRPDYLVLVEGSFTDLENGYVAQHCKIMHQLQGEHYGYNGKLNIYACKQLAPISDLSSLGSTISLTNVRFSSTNQDDQDF